MTPLETYNAICQYFQKVVGFQYLALGFYIPAYGYLANAWFDVDKSLGHKPIIISVILLLAPVLFGILQARLRQLYTQLASAGHGIENEYLKGDQRAFFHAQDKKGFEERSVARCLWEAFIPLKTSWKESVAVHSVIATVTLGSLLFGCYAFGCCAVWSARNIVQIVHRSSADRPAKRVGFQHAIHPDCSWELNRALVTKKDIDEAIAFETELEQNYARQAPEGTPWFTIKKGDSKVLVTAPHATNPTRNGELRPFADNGTGSLAEMLHRLAGATAVFTTFASPSDPNYYDDNDFKRALARLVDETRPVIVLDLHVSHQNRPYDLDIGTMNGNSMPGGEHLLNPLLTTLQKEGMRNFSTNYFPAIKAQTVTKFVSSKGVPCVQLEFSSTWTSPGRSDLHAHRYAQLLQAVVRFIGEVDNHGN